MSCAARRALVTVRAVETVTGCVRLKRPEQGVSSSKPTACSSADTEIPVGTFEKKYGGKRMSAKQPSLRGIAWLAVLTIVAGVFFGSQAVLRAGARRQNALKQEKDK